ncbi:hypothetical protein [Actinoplanes sp. NPDC023714]|uniref:hypothetical protein n=1 Tax=Actinoplanes sp. NPDC023714 TaxID=3154322 RepID=UPI0033D9BDF4
MPAPIRTWSLTAVQAVVAAAYFSGVIAYATTDALYFPEQAPPGWAWPAVVATAIGFLLLVPCLLLAVPLLAARDYRIANRFWVLLLAATAAGLAALLTMASPAGWEIFDWYVS